MAHRRNNSSLHRILMYIMLAVLWAKLHWPGWSFILVGLGILVLSTWMEWRR